MVVVSVVTVVAVLVVTVLVVTVLVVVVLTVVVVAVVVDVEHPFHKSRLLVKMLKMSDSNPTVVSSQSRRYTVMKFW